MVARLSIIRKNLPRSWVSALSVRHHSKSDTWTPGSWGCVPRMFNEALLPYSGQGDNILSACPWGQYSHYRANLQHKYQSWIYDVEYEDYTVINDVWDQIIHDPGSSTARWRTLCGKERSEDCILSYISTSWSSCSPVMHFGHNFHHLWS